MEHGVIRIIVCGSPRHGIKRGFHPTQRTQRKERKADITSSLIHYY